MFHTTIKFTSEYFKGGANVLDLNIKIINGKLKTDLFVKSANTHQFLDPSFYHPCYCKKNTLHSSLKT